MLKRWQIGVFYVLIESFAFSQSTKVNVSDVYISIPKKELSLKEFFEEIEKQTDYLFLYSKEDFNAHLVENKIRHRSNAGYASFQLKIMKI